MKTENLSFTLNYVQLFIFSYIITNYLTAQNVGINSTGSTAHPSAMLDVNASPANNSGFLKPRLTTAQRIAIVNPADGLEVYDTNLGGTYRFSSINNKWDCAQNPAGTVQYFANTVVPIGYLECNGQSVSTTTYPELFNAIGYTYGGSGASFNLPDLRGEFIRGWDNSRGIDDDVLRIIGSTQKGTVIWYDSAPTLNVCSINMASGTDAYARSLVGFDKTPDSDWPNTSIVYTQSSILSNNISTSGPQAHGGANNNYGILGTSRPRNIALMPCIKY